MAAFSRALRILWIVLRFPVLTLLAVLEPLVGFALTALALLMAIAAAAYACTVPFHAVPVVGLLVGALGLIVLVGLYGVAIRVLSA
jgi:hypothetical protein